jgi:subtilisin family serine protease
MYTPDPALYWGASIAVPGAAGGSVHAWNLAQKPFASFGVANYYNGDSLISVNELGGTAKRNITVGAYYGKLSYALWGGRWSPYPDDSGYHTLTLFSGRGPTVDGRIKPDITAPGSNQAGAMARFLTDKSNMVYWPDSPAVEDRYAVTGGTSVASPIVAGVVALMLEYNPSLTVEQARTIIQATAINDLATGPIGTMYNSLWGAGKVNALGAVDKMINGTAVGPPNASPREASSTYGLIRLSGNRLRFIGSAKSSSGELTVELFSLSGRRLMRQTSLRWGDVVTLAPLPQGVYFARAVEKGRVLCSGKVSVLY